MLPVKFASDKCMQTKLPWNWVPLYRRRWQRKTRPNVFTTGKLSGPLNRLNCYQPLDRYRAPSAIGSAIGRPYLALSRFHTQVKALNRLVLNRFRAQPRDSGAFKTVRNKSAIEAAILNRVLDRD